MSRAFEAGTLEKYRIELTLEGQITGVTTNTIAAMTYVKPVSHHARISLQWTATREIRSVATGGVAEVRENLAGFAVNCEPQPPPEERDERLIQSLRDFCEAWSRARSLEYQESPAGGLRASGAGDPVQLGEPEPQLLSAWLRRAARPISIFPALPFAPGAKSMKDVRSALEVLKGARGSETAEWSAEESDPALITLHTEQQLRWTAPPSANAAATQESFYADSVTTVALLDGSVSKASRSASRETLRVLEPVPGLPRPPEFRSKLTITVSIRRIS